MTLRDVRNSFVFWGGAIAGAVTLHRLAGWGWLAAGATAAVGAIVLVVLVAVATDRFLD